MARWEDDCEPGCRWTCQQGYYGSREVSVNCSSAALTAVPSIFPENTTRIDLSGNRLKTLDDTLRVRAPKLRELSLKNNSLAALDWTSVPETIQYFDIRVNDLTRLNYFSVKERNLTALWLSGNPFVCDCAVYTLWKWMRVHTGVVRDAKDITCAENSNPLVSGKPLVSLSHKDLCPDGWTWATAHIFLALGLLAAILALSAVLLRYKRNLKTWLQARGLGCLTSCITEDELDEEKLFDVFVSFSSKDDGFVDDNILTVLEAHGISYCTYQRNFKGGFLLQDIIRDAIAFSRRTLIVLTRLVVVVVDEMALNALDEDIRQYVLAVNYLRWGETNFQERLLRSLPKRDAKRKIIVEGSR
ncbi:hypothetical protein MTO96_018583 [Rhipicephalus appendiculatus]